MARKKGSVAVYDNMEARAILKDFDMVYDYESYGLFVEPWVDDILRGATGHFTANRRPSAYQLFPLLSILAEISTSAVSTILNMKRQQVEGGKYSNSYIKQWTAALRCASNGIVHNKPKEIWDFIE